MNDKILHFIVSAIVAAISAMLIANAGADVFTSCLGGALCAIWCGIGKEFGDRPTTGFDKIDLLADVLGAVVGCLAGFVSLLI